MTLQEIVDRSRRIVFFGGAGVSTESGIPDFRSVDGLYHQQYDYPPEQILMVGDAMGDYEAAKKNGVWFYPIVVNNEKESWQQLQEEAYPKLLHGTFDKEYQKELLDKFERGFQKTL